AFLDGHGAVDGEVFFMFEEGLDEGAAGVDVGDVFGLVGAFGIGHALLGDVGGCAAEEAGGEVCAVGGEEGEAEVVFVGGELEERGEGHVPVPLAGGVVVDEI